MTIMLVAKSIMAMVTAVNAVTILGESNNLEDTLMMPRRDYAFSVR
jgi:hypothetical protein